MIHPLGAVLVFFCFLSFAGAARAQQDSPFLNLDAGACEKLDDKNLQVGPPDEEMVAACAAIARRSMLGQRFSGGPGGYAFLVAGLLLVYAVLGAPSRAIAGLMSGADGRSRGALALGAALAALSRAAAALASLALLKWPYAIPAGCVAMLAATMLSTRSPRPSPSGETASSGASAVAADAINDLYASAAGLFGIALLARRDPIWLALGLALAVVASIPAVIAARRRLRREPTARLAAAAALSALFGAAAFADPDFAGWFGDETMAALAGAGGFALAALAAGWLARNATTSVARREPTA